mgnify:CR=1 FL=1
MSSRAAIDSRAERECALEPFVRNSISGTRRTTLRAHQRCASRDRPTRTVRSTPTPELRARRLPTHGEAALVRPSRLDAQRSKGLRKGGKSARNRVVASRTAALVADAPRTPEQLDRLWRRLRSRGGAAARNALVVAYQPLAQMAVRRLLGRLPRSVDPGDLLSAANVGLIDAIEGFDPARNVAFETYCEWRLRGALLDELRRQDWLPRPWRARLARWRRANDELRSRLGREPSDEEVAELLGWSLEQLPTAPYSPGGAAGRPDETLEELVEDVRAEHLSERLTREELLRLVSQNLTPQECRVVYLKYWEELPLREIGELEGLSESRVCKIHLRLIERLRDCLAHA